MNNVLIVDDMEVYRKLVREFLGTLHIPMNFFEANSGRPVERLIAEHDIHILVTDIVMEEREGLETIASVRKKFPNIKILAISGGGMSDANLYLDMARKLGANAALKKPFKKKEFIEIFKEKILDQSIKESKPISC